MFRIIAWSLIFSILASGCFRPQADYTKRDIVKIIDFELSPDESKIAFSAITTVGNTDIWVVDIYGKNLKKLTFQDLSLTNRVARFFKNHRWKNFFEIDMISPQWTTDARILFCQELSKTDIWGTRTVNFMFWTINPDGADKRPKTDKDKITQRKQADPINRAEISVKSDKYKKTILLKNGKLFILDL